MPTVAKLPPRITTPDGIGVSIDGNTVTLTKDGNNLSREFTHNSVSIRPVSYTHLTLPTILLV